MPAGHGDRGRRGAGAGGRAGARREGRVQGASPRAGGGGRRASPALHAGQRGSGATPAHGRTRDTPRRPSRRELRWRSGPGSPGPRKAALTMAPARLPCSAESAAHPSPKGRATSSPPPPKSKGAAGGDRTSTLRRPEHSAAGPQPGPENVVKGESGREARLLSRGQTGSAASDWWAGGRARPPGLAAGLLGGSGSRSAARASGHPSREESGADEPGKYRAAVLGVPLPPRIPICNLFIYCLLHSFLLSFIRSYLFRY